MCKILIRGALPPVLLALAVAPAAAQLGYAPAASPSLPLRYSPYLNLTRPGATAAANYYGLVRPEVAARNAYQSLQLQVNSLQQQVTAEAAAPAGTLPVTGYPVRFLDYSSYFPGGPGRGSYRPPTVPAASAAAAAPRPAPSGASGVRR
jgi:hypothetical protein